MDWEQGQESENVEDRRQLGPRHVAIGGVGLLVIMLIGYFLGVDPQKINKVVQVVNNAQVGVPDNDQGAERPATAEEERSRKFTATILRFTEQVWGKVFRQAGKTYEPPHMVLFSDEVQTGCGDAPSAVGPFYCPADRTVYLDPTFFNELQQKLGGSKADFSQAYVIAHEVGHHVQNLLGYRRIADEKRRTVPKAEINQWSVRIELQADYLAGVWAYHGQQEFNFIQPGDVEAAIQSANAIGDDRLQKRARGFVSPESFTHGTSAQRVKWFRLGLETGDLGNLKKIFELPYSEL
jgi:predicted metalloprotease